LGRKIRFARDREGYFSEERRNCPRQRSRPLQVTADEPARRINVDGTVDLAIRRIAARPTPARIHLSRQVSDHNAVHLRRTSSDATRTWFENPYYYLFCDEEFLSPPAALRSIGWRRRTSEEKLGQRIQKGRVSGSGRTLPQTLVGQVRVDEAPTRHAGQAAGARPRGTAAASYLSRGVIRGWSQDRTGTLRKRR
jgi:hypothetical protein